MKKILPLLCIALLMGACKTKHESLSWETAQWTDSVAIDKGSNHSTAGVSISIEYPANGDQALTESISAWICEQLGDSTHAYLHDITGLVSTTGTSILKQNEAEILDCIGDDEEAGYCMPYTYECEGKVCYEDETYITLYIKSYQYTGGAHGGADFYAATFRKADGHRMDWDLMEGMSQKEIRQAIIKGLYTYFEVDNEPDLRDCLMIFTEDGLDIDNLSLDEYLPLPQAAPYLTKEGVQIIYQQYEIACYAAGMPECTVK